MLTYEPGTTPVHGLDPRSKLAFQVGFAVAALAHPIGPSLVAFAAMVVAALWLADVRIREAVVAYRLVLVVLVPAPLVAALALGPPWVVPADGVATALASARVYLIVLLSGAYVRTTASRDSRAAIQRTVPGRPGRALGMGVGLVFRFLPVLVADLRRIREASLARLGDRRGPVARGAHLGARGLERTFDRADRLSLALRARCLSWNPTLPPLAMRGRDWAVVAAAVALAVSPLAL